MEITKPFKLESYTNENYMTLVYLLIYVQTQEITSTVSSLEPHTGSPEDDPNVTSLSDVAVPEIILDTQSGSNIVQDTQVNNKVYYKPIPPDIFHKFSKVHWWRPVQENFDKLKQYLEYTKHPNYGGVQFLSPQEIWERFHEKGHHLLTGINGAIFGLGNVENHDYPFAYRELESMKIRT